MAGPQRSEKYRFFVSPKSRVSVISRFSEIQMDVQYYKRLLISISGIYIVYLSYGLVQEKMLRSCLCFISRYRYVSSDGTSFQYTSVLLLIQCTINYVIAVLGMCSDSLPLRRTICPWTGS